MAETEAKARNGTPPGFGFSDTAFRVFIPKASRRLKSDRFFTDDFRPEVYTQAGFAWVRAWGGALLPIAAFQVPGRWAPVRARWCNVVGIAGREARREFAVASPADAAICCGRARTSFRRSRIEATEPR